MDYNTLIGTLSVDIVARLRKAVEIGRWPDGTLVTAAQREHSLQAIIAWEQAHVPKEQRVGFIDKGRKGGVAVAGDSGPDTLRWVDDSPESAR